MDNTYTSKKPAPDRQQILRNKSYCPTPKQSTINKILVYAAMMPVMNKAAQ